jgi:hypothetical protein
MNFSIKSTRPGPAHSRSRLPYRSQTLYLRYPIVAAAAAAVASKIASRESPLSLSKYKFQAEVLIALCGDHPAPCYSKIDWFES